MSPIRGPAEGGSVLVLDVVVTGATIAANVVAAYSDFTRGRFAVVMSDKVGVPQSFFPVSGSLKAAGAAGLALGLAGVPFIGIAAATGLVLFFVGAIVTVVRARWYAHFYPIPFLLLAAVALTLRLTTL